MANYSTGFPANETPISEGGAWTSGPGGWVAINTTGGRARGEGGSDFAGARVVSPAIGADQYAQIVIQSAGSGLREGGPLVRMASTTDGDCYIYDLTLNAGVQAIYRCDDTGGSLGFTRLGADFAGAPSSGTTYKLTVSGTTFEAFEGGVSKGTRTDGTYAVGQPGFFIASANAADTEIDDFIGGDPFVPSIRVGPFRRARRAGWSVSSPGGFF